MKAVGGRIRLKQNILLVLEKELHGTEESCYHPLSTPRPRPPNKNQKSTPPPYPIGSAWGLETAREGHDVTTSPPAPLP